MHTSYVLWFYGEIRLRLGLLLWFSSSSSCFLLVLATPIVSLKPGHMCACDSLSPPPSLQKDDHQQHTASPAASASRRLKHPKPKGCQAHADYIRRHGSGGFLFFEGWTPWWTRLTADIKSSNLKTSRRVEAPSAPGRFLHYPLTYPMRYTGQGVGICRFYNYHKAGCLKGDACQYDHETCHYCGQAGHRALGCPAVQGSPSSLSSS